LGRGITFKLVGIIAVIAILFVTIAPAFDVDPTALRARHNADLVFWSLAAVAQIVLGLLSAFVWFLIGQADPLCRFTNTSEITVCWLC
jgi:small-conductance mechanosensitive channel